MNSSDYVLENYIAVDSKFPPTLWANPPDLLFPYTNNGAESYHSHLNAEFYVKHPKIYVFVDVLRKIQQTAYVSMKNISQQARKSKYERKQRLWCLHILRLSQTAYILQERNFRRKYFIVIDRELNCDSALRVDFVLM